MRNNASYVYSYKPGVTNINDFRAQAQNREANTRQSRVENGRYKILPKGSQIQTHTHTKCG